MPEYDPASRNAQFEADFLDQAVRNARGRQEWAEDVIERVDRMSREKGDAYLGMSLRRMLHEIDEEGLDLGGWPVLTALLCMRIEDGEVRQYAQTRLLQIAALGAQVRTLVADLRGVLGDA